MSGYSLDFRDAILVYLQKEFPAFSIREEKDKSSYCFRLLKESDTHFVRVMYTAIEDFDPSELIIQLEQYAVADTMRGLGDFPVVVTEQGCMFGSP